MQQETTATRLTQIDKARRERELLQLLAMMRAKRDFLSFLVFINPKYHAKWFHKLIARKCQAVYNGDIQKLMVFVPPQHGKSEIISRHFPLWCLGNDPDMKIVGSSYSGDLACQFGRSIQRTMDTPEYAAVFPDGYAAAQHSRGYIHNADMFETVGHHGFYKAVGVGGSLTGTPADLAIIDDPVKDALEANSRVYRDRVWDWYNTVLSTRLHNQSRQILIMTRWHEDDLAGRILQAQPNEWEILSIPALCEVEHDGGMSDRHVGDALWPERHSREKLEKQRDMSPREFAALYQQRPAIEGGNIVHRDWFNIIPMSEFQRMRFQEPIHFYLDTAYNKKQRNADNDPSGILAACRVKGNIFILHAQRVWKEMPDLLRFLPNYIETHGGNSKSILHVEPKANGISVIQMLKSDTTLNVKQTKTPTEDKEVRLRVVSPRIECGRVFLVDGSWTNEFLDEVTSFPAAPHDEFVDILGYAINDLFEDEMDFSHIDKSFFGL